MAIPKPALILATASSLAIATAAVADPVLSALHLKKGIMYQGELCMMLEYGIQGPPQPLLWPLRIGIITFGDDYHLVATKAQSVISGESHPSVFGPGFGTLVQAGTKTQIKLTNNFASNTGSTAWSAESGWNSVYIELDNSVQVPWDQFQPYNWMSTTPRAGYYTLDGFDVNPAAPDAPAVRRLEAGEVWWAGPCPDGQASSQASPSAGSR